LADIEDEYGNKNARVAGIFIWRSGRGLAYLRQAADSLASESLRVLPEAAQAAPSTPQNAMFAFANIEKKWA